MKKYDEVSVVCQLNNVDAVIGINPASKVIKVAKNSASGNDNCYGASSHKLSGVKMQDRS